MIRKPKLASKALRDEFRRERGQSSGVPKPSAPSRKRPTNTPYTAFLEKYASIESSINDFGTRDLVYYFREIAEENGYKYVISNIKKDMGIMKRLRGNYSNKEICGMIEFLFESDQDYLKKDRLSINLLASQWINTIYADMKLWVEDKYVPKTQAQESKRKKSQREWSSDEKDSVKIGVKL